MAHTNQGCQGLGLKCSDEPQLVLEGQASHRCSRLLHLPLGYCCLLSHLHLSQMQHSADFPVNLYATQSLTIPIIACIVGCGRH